MNLKVVALTNPIPINWRIDGTNAKSIVVENIKVILPPGHILTRAATNATQEKHAAALAKLNAEILDLARSIFFKERLDGTAHPFSLHSIVDQNCYLQTPAERVARGGEVKWVLLGFDQDSATLTVQLFAEFQNAKRARSRQPKPDTAGVVAPSQNQRARYLLAILGIAVAAALGFWVFGR